MQIDLYNTEEFIRVNKLQLISNPILFVKGTPSSDGLLSPEIFGLSSKDKKETFAYIDLHDYFIQPFIYKLLKRMDKRFESIVHGNRYFRIEKGQLVEDEENGETGLKFLYNNWEKFNFKKNESVMRGERIDLLTSYDKNTLFTRYCVVLPLFYRDVNYDGASSGKLSHNPINDKYSKLIRLCTNIEQSNNFDFVLNATKANVQDLLVEIYDYFKDKLAKKTGMIRKSLMGKSIDYGARLVISAPTFHSDSYKDMQIDFKHCGVPLAQCCSLFNPFIVAWVRNYFVQTLSKSLYKYPVKTKDGITTVKLKDPTTYIDDHFIKTKIDNYIKNINSRFDPIELMTEDGKLIYMNFVARIYEKGKPESESPIIDRYATWTDILFMAAVDVTSDKSVIITRYPVNDYFGTFANMVTVMSTTKTIPMFIDNTVYSRYPVVEPNDTDLSTKFIDTLTMSNVYLKGLGGDYDGDQISIRAVFTQEANIEARNIITKKSNILNIYGDNMRTIGNEAMQTVYSLTKKDD